MPVRKKHAASLVPTLQTIPIAMINEPAHPIRLAIDEEALNDLAESIASVGLLQPIIVVPSGVRFEIVAGHRRFLASRIANMASALCLVYTDKNFATQAALLHENVNRADISAAEEAIWFAELVEKHGYNEEQLCKAVRKKPNYVADRLRLMEQCPMVFEQLKQGNIQFSIARELNKITEKGVRLNYLDVAAKGGVNARTVMSWVADWKMSNAQPIVLPPIGEAGDPGSVPLPPDFGCKICGGTQEQHMMEHHRMHKYCWARIVSALNAHESEGQ